MVTQKTAQSVVKGGGRIFNRILVDQEGTPKGKLTEAQVQALIQKGMNQHQLYDGSRITK